jgi:hypothetical protein
MYLHDCHFSTACPIEGLETNRSLRKTPLSSIGKWAIQELLVDAKRLATCARNQRISMLSDASTSLTEKIII